MQRRSSLLALALVAWAGTASAQTPRGMPSPGTASAERLIRQGDAAHTALRPGEALEAFLAVLASEPGNYDALWRASRESVNLGMLAPGPEERKSHYAAAEAMARRARAARPGGVEGAEWLAIAMGRQALDQGPRARARYAVEVRTVALEALALDSLNAGAHHVLGMWHAEVRRLSGVERWLAQRVLGAADFKEASWEAAERHLRRAVDLEGSGLIHHLDLAGIYRDTGRAEEARQSLRQVLERPAVEPVDPLHKQAAQEILRALAPGLDDPAPGPGLSG